MQDHEWLNFRGIPYKPDENGTAKEVLCPLVDDWIEDIDCLEYQGIAEWSIPARFKLKPRWKEICEHCPFRDY